ncbi:hypothetical protein EI94DRAFT_499560 [Lactarius quietus]|nr:hypothetical protein EI94DRAFT_499560 [Lactarius quietus]
MFPQRRRQDSSNARPSPRDMTNCDGNGEMLLTGTDPNPAPASTAIMVITVMGDSLPTQACALDDADGDNVGFGGYFMYTLKNNNSHSYLYFRFPRQCLLFSLIFELCSQEMYILVSERRLREISGSGPIRSGLPEKFRAKRSACWNLQSCRSYVRSYQALIANVATSGTRGRL